MDPDHAEEVVVNALKEVDGVLHDRGLYVLPRGFGDNAGTVLQVRWRHEPDLHSESHTLARVVPAIRRALDDADIDVAPPELRMIEDPSVAEHHKEEEL